MSRPRRRCKRERDKNQRTVDDHKFFFGAFMVLAALAVLFMGRRQLGAVDAPETTLEHQQVIVEELEAAAGA